MEANGSGESYTPTDELPKYPDTGETGETYDLEFQEAGPDPRGKEAIGKVAEFFNGHSKQTTSADKLNR